MENRVKVFDKALGWIKRNTIDGHGVAVTSRQQVIYPEVTGYYIPTLLEWGERDLAVSYARYLCSIQKSDGSWYDAYDKAPYVFDTAQILKGLLSIREILPQADSHIIKGCEWLISNVDAEGRLETPSKDAWGGDEGFCSELIHLYCLTPLVEASEVFDKPEYCDIAHRILGYYKKNYRKKILDFSLLSHFYAYVMEGLLDMGEVKLVREAMRRLERFQDRQGGIPGLRDVKWVCSTGMFQIALVWYKLGEMEKGDRIFRYACGLQNRSGGWYGSYPASFLGRFSRKKKKAYYFPHEEISWANKYFLDALAYREKLSFEKMAPTFLDDIDREDGRYILIKQLMLSKNAPGGISVCDIGCGKGRYLKRLAEECPVNDYYAMDLSEKVMEGIDRVRKKRTGRLTQIPYADGTFDMVYVCEAFEHAINLKGAFKELYRIVKPGGRLAIIDKPLEKLGRLEIYEWERWISDGDIKRYTASCGGKLEIVRSVPYEDGKDDGLFRAWIVTKQ